MFGIGNNRQRGRTETFAPSRIRGAAIAGLGMLAWQMWKKRQQTARPPNRADQPFSESSRTPSTDAY